MVHPTAGTYCIRHICLAVGSPLPTKQRAAPFAAKAWEPAKDVLHLVRKQARKIKLDRKGATTRAII
jgi:hypothetical protein